MSETAAKLSSDHLSKASEFVRRSIGAKRPRTAVVLGSGLSGIARKVTDSVSIDFAEIPGFPQPTVAGHTARVTVGRLAGEEVLVQAGRFHLYEGHSNEAVLFPIRTWAQLGVESIIVTNAAGSLRSDWTVPSVMLIADHINWMFRSPLRGLVEGNEQRFPDVAHVYDSRLADASRAAAADACVSMYEGTYAAVLGPQYETPAEIKMLKILGADAVGMSTVPEVVAASALGLRVVGLSVLTNKAAGIGSSGLSHDEVLAASAVVEEGVAKIISGILTAINQSPGM